MKTIKAIIVDDEESARDVLENLLLLFCQGVEIKAKCSNVEDAVAQIKQNRPDVVFLDIEMPKYAGYEIVRFFEKIDFQLVFVTAYDQYAIKAFEVAALDYLLKPVDIQRLQQTVERVEKQINVIGQAERLDLLKESLEKREIQNIIVFDKAQQYIVPIQTIIAIEAMESYCRIYCLDRTLTASKNLAHFENNLENCPTFFRTHRSWIINKQHIEHYTKSDLSIQLKNKLTTKLSKYRKAEFEDFLIG